MVKEGRISGDWKVEGDVTKGDLETKGRDGERSTVQGYVEQTICTWRMVYTITKHIISLSQKLGLKAETSEQ